MSTTIEDRVILLLRDQASEAQLDSKPSSLPEHIRSWIGYDPPREHGGHGFWERLGEYTNISSKRWRMVYARKQRITSDMFEALAKLFPTYAFWLSTGITDATNGHLAPRTAQTFPERMYQGSHATEQYFSKSIKLLDKLYQEANINLEDEKERMYAAERTRPLAHWLDSPLSETAYKISSSAEYKEILEIWRNREEERRRHVKFIAEPDERPWVIDKKKYETEGVRASPIFGLDPRTMHQDRWDLFYQPAVDQDTKFARQVLNVSPRDLNDDQVEAITKLSYWEVSEYLAHHQISKTEVFPFRPGSIRNGDQSLNAEEINGFRTMVSALRDKK